MSLRRLTESSATFRSPTSGELNQRVKFRRRTDMPVDTAWLKPEFSREFKTWAKVRQVGDTVRIGTAQIDNAITHKITIRYREGVDTDFEIIHGGMVYRVKGAEKLNGQKRFLQISCEELSEINDDG